MLDLIADHPLLTAWGLVTAFVIIAIAIKAAKQNKNNGTPAPRST